MTISALLHQSFRNLGDHSCLSFVDHKPLSYSEVEVRINETIVFLKEAGITKGDKVALLGENMPSWGIVYLAITMMGAVVVPILPDFLPEEIESIITHSESKVLFVSQKLSPKVTDLKSTLLKFIIKLDDFSVIRGNLSRGFDRSKQQEKQYFVEEEDLAAIIYTSGTTGRSKGVMLSHKNIASNVIQGMKVQYIDEKDRFLSILPLSHTYENTLGFLLALACGSTVYYLDRQPSPTVFLAAMQKVKPTIILSVPLIIEKIYRARIKPTFRKNKLISSIYGVPLFRKALNRVAGKKLLKSFGGKLRFFGIGGAKLNALVEAFLREAKFPYAIGYGLTETSPLLAGSNPSNTRFQSTGPAVDMVELRINEPDQDSDIGEIWAKGPNVMKGYYKDPVATSEVFTDDGWFKTGDYGLLDKDGSLYIMGRKKNMIVRANGENIYPEEIEALINDYQYVTESLVVEKMGKLVAMVHINREELEKQYQHLKDEVAEYIDRKIEEMMSEIYTYINKRVNKFSRLHDIVYQPNPFQKTATQKIKRFLYT